MADTDWFVAVENFEDIDQFITALDGVLRRRMSCFEHSCRASKFNSEMKFWEVPDECKDVVRKFLEARKFLILEDDVRSEELGSALRKSKDHSGPSASRRRSLLSIFNESMKRPKDKEKAAAKQR
ncbi:hypothetical protein OESDEN_20492 [Oesophagostomum dentatum]|uniref:Uncharacterized protein n=1 Tax=Oesophagostomum dentatum TaxID=61180 RepID=A0A0B1S3A9_OESDE|nr:hypothetical protein OESDEN_20492 [Oesophagostomum dentatum]